MEKWNVRVYDNQTNMTNQQKILNQIKQLRKTQDHKWGKIETLSLSNGDWITRLGEEFGEICEASLDGKKKDIRRELLDLVGVAVSWLERIDIKTKHTKGGKDV